MSKAPSPSPSSDDLRVLLSEQPSCVERLVAAGIHRTELWRYSTGRVTPSAERAALLERVTGDAGRPVLANGWTPHAELPGQEAAVEKAASFPGGHGDA